jgi:hypothetical protein
MSSVALCTNKAAAAEVAMPARRRAPDVSGSTSSAELHRTHAGTDLSVAFHIGSLLNSVSWVDALCLGGIPTCAELAAEFCS